MLVKSTHKVLLPEWVVTATNVNELAQQYLSRYEGYELIEVIDCFAICRKI